MKASLEKASEIFMVRLTPTQKRAISQASGSKPRNMSAWAKEQLDRAANMVNAKQERA